jgi:hypothetical protein
MLKFTCFYIAPPIRLLLERSLLEAILKLLLPVMLAFLCGIEIASADVITSATCQVGTSPAISDPANCSINSTNSQPSARASVAVNQLTAIPDGGLSTTFAATLTGLASAIPLSNIGTGPNIASSAAANATVTYQLFTQGPVRPGIITYTGSYSNWQVGSGNNPAQISASVGSLSGSCTGIQPFCTGPLLGTPTPHSVAFTLGNSFGFQLSESFTAYGDPFVEGPGFASGTAFLNFQLFEADGRTPVAIYAAPEPGTLGLLLICLGGFGAAYHICRRRALPAAITSSPNAPRAIGAVSTIPEKEAL